MFISQVTRTLFTIIIAYLVSWLPYAVRTRRRPLSVIVISLVVSQYVMVFYCIQHSNSHPCALVHGGFVTTKVLIEGVGGDFTLLQEFGVILFFYKQTNKQE